MREKIVLIASGKIASGFDMVTKIALGADSCNVARAMMFAIGCIQALKCETNHCPTGVTTQDPHRIKAIDPERKAVHVKNYHQATMRSFAEILAAMGIDNPDKLSAKHIRQRVSDNHSCTYADIAAQLQPGELLSGHIHSDYREDWEQASAERF